MLLEGIGRRRKRIEPALFAGLHVLDHPPEERPVAEKPPDLEFGRDVGRPVADERIADDFRASEPHALCDKFGRHYRPKKRTRPELDARRRALNSTLGVAPASIRPNSTHSRFPFSVRGSDAPKVLSS